MDTFKFEHKCGSLTAVIGINGVVYKEDIKKYFESSNGWDDWIDFRLGLSKDSVSNTLFQNGDVFEMFKLENKNGQLIAFARINGKIYKKNVTEYFEANNPYNEWLDYRIEMNS